MSSKPFFIIIITLTILMVVTSPPVVHPYLLQEPTPTPTSVTPTATSTPTLTPDPFANVPTVTPQTNDIVIEVNTLPPPALGEPPPTYTPTPPITTSTSSDPSEPVILLPDPTINDDLTSALPAPSREPATIPPDRLRIPRLALDVPVVPVGMAPALAAEPGMHVSPGMPKGKVVGWVDTSASFGRPGNTVLTGRHQAEGLTVFHGLWNLETGDEIVLYAGQQRRRYLVTEVLILPEQDQPLEVRLSNAEYIQPTENEQLTIVTGWPEKVNTHRTVVIARPMQNDE